MSDTLDRIMSFAIETCCNTQCGIAFAMPVYYRDRKKEDHSMFHCPNGHPQHYTGQSDAEKWKSAYEREQSSTQFWRNDSREKERRLSAARGQVTKIKNRIANGVCPCCKRSFSNLSRHMETKHPKFKTEEA